MRFKHWLEAKATSGEEYFYNKKTRREEPVPVVFIRFGDLPKENSINHLLGKQEKGVSVFAAHYDRTSKKFILQSGGEQLLNTQQEIAERPAYLVTGTPNGESGADGEQLLDRNSIRIIRKLDPKEITAEQTPNFDILGNDIQEPHITFPHKNQDLSEIRRKTFKMFNNMNLSKETNGRIDRDESQLRLIIKRIGEEKEREIYQNLPKEELKALGFSISMDYINSPRIKGQEATLFRIKDGKIII